MAANVKETSEETEEKEESLEEIPSQLSGSLNTNRSVIDKNWSFFFIIIFFIWSSSWYYAIYYYRPTLTISSANYTSKTDKVTHYYFWGKNWFFDAITCNLVFLNTHYESSGSIVIWTNILLSIGLIAYSISFMKNHYMYQSQLDKACCYLIFLSFCFRLLTFISNYSEGKSVIRILTLPSHEQGSCWLMPEVFCIMVWYTKKCYKCDDVVLAYIDDLLRFIYVMIPYVALSLAIYSALYIYSMDMVFKLGWDCPLSWTIVGGSFYISLTIYYFLSMVISSAVYYSFFKRITDRSSRFFGYNDYSEFYKSMVMVSRYHFGTACYHATLIFPRLHSLFVMNEPEFKAMPRLKKFIDRFCEVQCKQHYITLTVTAFSGGNHSASLRGLLTYFDDSTSPKLEYFQSFSQITKALLALLMSMNNLMLITLWYYGLDDSQLSLATWAFYLRLMIFWSVPMKFCDVAADTILLMRGAPFNGYYIYYEYLSKIGKKN